MPEQRCDVSRCLFYEGFEVPSHALGWHCANQRRFNFSIGAKNWRADAGKLGRAVTRYHNRLFAANLFVNCSSCTKVRGQYPATGATVERQYVTYILVVTYRL